LIDNAREKQIPLHFPQQCMLVPGGRPYQYLLLN